MSPTSGTTWGSGRSGLQGSREEVHRSCYDENALASARAYGSISLPGSLWSLERATAEWTEAVTMAPAELTMIHPLRGEISLDDMIVANAHDAAHHVWDIRRSLGRQPS